MISYEELRDRLRKARKLNKRAVTILKDLTDDTDECFLDDQNHCWTHDWNRSDQLCPNKRAKNFLNRLEKRAKIRS